jgi:hypothetical protein
MKSGIQETEIIITNQSTVYTRVCKVEKFWTKNILNLTNLYAGHK